MNDGDEEGFDPDTAVALLKLQADLEQHKPHIMAALKRGFERGARSTDILRPASFDAETAWNAILGAAINIRNAKLSPDRIRTGRKGRPFGRTAQDPVALLAPIYRRFAGARTTASHPHNVRRKALIAYGGAELASRKKAPHTGGPFVAFVQAVSEACGLRLGAASIDKMFAILEANCERDDRLAEAQVKFASTYRTAAELFAHVKIE